jgi:hypothetical protein
MRCSIYTNDVTVVNPLIDMYAKMKHEDKYLDEAVKQKNNRYAERCNAAGLNFMHLNLLGRFVWK